MARHEFISLAEPVATMAERRHKSAGLAWLLSLIVPGAGQCYVGTRFRGGLAIAAFAGLSLYAIVAAMNGSNAGAAVGLVIMTVPPLYAFASVDAYFTARELNRGIDPSVVDNPRVAAALNLLGRGFGYFYLGERVKGVVMFVLLVLVQIAASAVSDGRRQTVALAAIHLVAIAAAVHAYWLAKRSFASQLAVIDVHPEQPETRLPAVIPMIVTGAILALVGVLFLVGVVAVLVGAAEP